MATTAPGEKTILDHFKEITDRITEMCAARHRPCSERVAAYTLRAVTLDSTTEFDFEKTLTARQMQSLIEMSVGKILEADNPAMETIKMQAAFDGVNVCVDQEIREKVKAHDAETATLIEAVVEFATRLKSDGQIPAMYKLVFDALASNSYVKMPLDRMAEREIAAALQSAFPKARIMVFAQMPAEQKREQISSLINIVLGIRLFNRYLGKGGIGLDDTPEILTTAVSILESDLDSEVNDVTSSSNRYAALIRMEFALPGTIASSLPRLQDEYRNRQQFGAFLNRILREIQEASELVNNAIQHFDAEVETLKGLVNSRVSVPKGQVFPKFDNLGRLWRALDAEVDRNKGKRVILEELLKFKSNFKCSICQEDILVLEDPGVLERVKAAETKEASAHLSRSTLVAGSAVPSLHPALRISPSEAQSINNLEIEFDSYCPWTIVHRDGLLLLGDLGLGIVQYRNRYYAFTDLTGLTSFVAAPDKMLDEVHVKVKAAPELINLLHLQSHYPNVTGLNESSKQDVSMYGESNAKVDAGTETPVHFISQAIDPGYTWNHWDLRRRALKIVHLRQCSTHSTQTTQTYHRREAETQVYVKQRLADNTMPGVGVQTGIDKGTSTVRRLRYIQGLRSSANVNIVTLEM